MILLVHKEEEVYEIIDLITNQIVFNTIKRPTRALFIIANKYKERILVWCHLSQRDNINFEGIKTSFDLKNMMLSFSTHQYLPEQIGYVEDSPFLKVNKEVKYPTWLMSSEIGAIHASQLLKFKNFYKSNEPLNFVLNSMAKLGMSNGLFCYSEPNLLVNKTLDFPQLGALTFRLFKFVKQHYKSVWGVLLLLNYIVYEKRFPIISFIRTLFIKKLKFSSNFDLEPLFVQPLKEVSIDVIIPTLGRKAFLHDVLLDLEKQTFLPKKVIIVEQNEYKNSESELDFIENKTWAFKIIHKFIHQTGACNARNLALKEVTSDFVFFADDDIRIKSNFIEESIAIMLKYQFQTITLSCLQEKDIKKFTTPKQWSTFGSGCSIVKSSCIKDLIFDMVYEFSFGEDADFGMQLRNKGTDIIYLPRPEIIHLKAPIGGFRTFHKHIWNLKGDNPKPSPTISLYRLEHQTTKQLNGYKTVLFFKFYVVQPIKNPYKYYQVFKKQWRQSIYWANHLKDSRL